MKASGASQSKMREHKAESDSSEIPRPDDILIMGTLIPNSCSASLDVYINVKIADLGRHNQEQDFVDTVPGKGLGLFTLADSSAVWCKNASSVRLLGDVMGIPAPLPKLKKLADIPIAKIRHESNKTIDSPSPASDNAAEQIGRMNIDCEENFANSIAPTGVHPITTASCLPLSPQSGIPAPSSSAGKASRSRQEKKAKKAIHRNGSPSTGTSFSRTSFDTVVSTEFPEKSAGSASSCHELPRGESTSEATKLDSVRPEISAATLDVSDPGNPEDFFAFDLVEGSYDLQEHNQVITLYVNSEVDRASHLLVHLRVIARFLDDGHSFILRVGKVEKPVQKVHFILNYSDATHDLNAEAFRVEPPQELTNDEVSGQISCNFDANELITISFAEPECMLTDTEDLKFISEISVDSDNLTSVVSRDKSISNADQSGDVPADKDKLEANILPAEAVSASYPEPLHTKDHQTISDDQSNLLHPAQEGLGHVQSRLVDDLSPQLNSWNASSANDTTAADNSTDQQILDSGTLEHCVEQAAVGISSSSPAGSSPIQTTFIRTIADCNPPTDALNQMNDAFAFEVKLSEEIASESSASSGDSCDSKSFGLISGVQTSDPSDSRLCQNPSERSALVPKLDSGDLILSSSKKDIVHDPSNPFDPRGVEMVLRTDSARNSGLRTMTQLKLHDGDMPLKELDSMVPRYTSLVKVDFTPMADNRWPILTCFFVITFLGDYVSSVHESAMTVQIYGPRSTSVVMARVQDEQVEWLLMYKDSLGTNCECQTIELPHPDFSAGQAFCLVTNSVLEGFVQSTSLEVPYVHIGWYQPIKEDILLAKVRYPLFVKLHLDDLVGWDHIQVHKDDADRWRLERTNPQTLYIRPLIITIAAASIVPSLVDNYVLNETHVHYISILIVPRSTSLDTMSVEFDITLTLLRGSKRLETDPLLRLTAPDGHDLNWVDICGYSTICYRGQTSELVIMDSPASRMLRHVRISISLVAKNIPLKCITGASGMKTDASFGLPSVLDYSVRQYHVRSIISSGKITRIAYSRNGEHASEVKTGGFTALVCDMSPGMQIDCEYAPETCDRSAQDTCPTDDINKPLDAGQCVMDMQSVEAHRDTSALEIRVTRLLRAITFLTILAFLMVTIYVIDFQGWTYKIEEDASQLSNELIVLKNISTYIAIGQRDSMSFMNHLHASTSKLSNNMHQLEAEVKTMTSAALTDLETRIYKHMESVQLQIAPVQEQAQAEINTIEDENKHGGRFDIDAKEKDLFRKFLLNWF